jgi:hypothetical protein
MDARPESEALIQNGVRSFLVVTCGGTRLAIPGEIIRGIVRPEEGAVPDALRSLNVNRVGELADRLGLTSTVSASDPILICGTAAFRRAFRVGGVAGLHDVRVECIFPLLPHFRGPERHWFSGMFFYSDSVALVIDSRWLLGQDLGPDQTADSAAAPTASDEARACSAQWLASDGLSDPMRFDLIELEEATDADDLPWAEL